MSDLAQLNTRELFALPDIRRAPAAFRAALRLFARHWLWGSMTFVLPSGREIPVLGREPGPAARKAAGARRMSGRANSSPPCGRAWCRLRIATYCSGRKARSPI